MKNNPGELLDYDWHDAEIKSIKILLDGKVEILFKCIRTFHQYKPTKVTVWLSQANVLLSGVTSISVDNIITDEYIDAELLDDKHNPVELLPLYEEKAVSLFKIFVAGLGTNIDIKASTARFGFMEHIAYIQDAN